jgi:hypothetical protein
VSGQLHVEAPLPPGKEPLVTIGKRLGSRVSIGEVRKRKFPSPHRESNPAKHLFIIVNSGIDPQYLANCLEKR